MTIPASIAPLNFDFVGGECDRIDVTITGSRKGILHINASKVLLPEEEWSRLLTENKDGNLTFVVCVKQQGKWKKYRPFSIYVCSYPVDRYLVYRKIAPGYEVYSKMGIYQRDLHSFKEKALLENTLLPGMTFAYIGSFIALLLFMPMVNSFSVGHNETYGWTMSVVIIAIMCAVLFYGCFAWTKERVTPMNKQQSPLKEDLKDLLRNRPWWILLGAGVAALVFNSIRDGATVYYFKYFIVEESYATISLFGVSFVLSGLYLATGQIANIIGVVLAAPVSNRIGKKATYMGAMVIATVLSVIFYWFGKGDLTLIFTFQILISICAGSIFPLLWSMYADCADYSELRTGNRATGLVFSSSSMAF